MKITAYNLHCGSFHSESWSSTNQVYSALVRSRRCYEIKYGTEWSGNQAHETNLHAVLTKPDLPPNVSEALVLEYKEGKVQGVEAFLASVNKYENLFLSIPWLANYVREHEQVPIRISYVHNASFGDKALQVFTKDMHALGRDDLAQDATNKQPEITLLITGMTYAESYWLVFPDKQVILWRYNGPSGLLKWKPGDFLKSECADYGIPFGGCVGATINSDGKLK